MRHDKFVAGLFTVLLVASATYLLSMQTQELVIYNVMLQGGFDYITDTSFSISMEAMLFMNETIQVSVFTNAILIENLTIRVGLNTSRGALWEFSHVIFFVNASSFYVNSFFPELKNYEVIIA